MEERDEMSRVFWEEDLVLSMMHKDQCVASSLIGDLNPSLALEASVQYCLVVGPMGKCIEEAK